MATKGRGGDSMLVHMTPGEVQALQALAQRHGGTLTINPETGQPEANFLKKLLPAIAGAALNFFAPGVGTAVGGMFGLGAAAGTGIAVGGISALATGSLSRGLMAGMGAYGGASLAGSLANAGTGALSSEAGNAALAAEGLTGDAALTSAADDVAQRAIGERLASATPYDKMSAGFKAVTNSPAAMGNFAKNNMQSGLMAISPIMADEGVQTTTPKQDTGNIRRFSFDRYGQTYTPQGVFPAAGYTGMAQGGIVALAAGGVSDAEIQNWMAANKGASDATIAAAMQEYNVSPQQLSSAMGYNPTEVAQRYEAAIAPANTGFTNYSQAEIGNYLAANPNADIAAATQQFNADPRAVNQYIVGLTQNYADPSQTQRGTGTFGYYDALKAQGIDANELFAANQGLTPNYNFVGDSTVGQMARAYDVAGEFKGFDPQVGNQVANDIEWVKKMDELGRDSVDIARATGLSIGEVQAREAAARAAMKKEVVRPIVPGPINEVPYVPGGVSGGGNTVVNPNGTITTTPNIPGRPEGGFTGIGQLRDVYTQGGGSLGYVNPAPKTTEEFDQRFNKQTTDSLAAYNYLMGKGANPATQQRVGEIARPYSEAVVGIPAAAGRPNQKYIYEGGRYVENPNYVPITYDTKGNRNVGMTSAEVRKGLLALPDQTDDAAIFDWVDENQISIAQLAAAMKISVGEAQRRMNAAKKKAGATTATSVNDGGYGGDAGDAADGGIGGGSDGSAGASVSGTPGWAYGGQVQRMALGGLGSLAKGGVAELPDGAFVLPARITSEVGNGSTNAGAQKLHAMEQRLLGENAQPVNLGRYSGGGNLVRGKGDGVSDSVPATIGGRQPARIADGEYIVSSEAVKKLGNGSTEAGARKLYAMMDRVQKARGKTTGKSRVAANTRADKYLPA
jgi:hypothetical protein